MSSIASTASTVRVLRCFSFTELARRLNEFAITLTGPAGAFFVGDENAVDDGLWARGYLNAFSATIGGGTSEIQHNIIAEHVLGLPK